MLYLDTETYNEAPIEVGTFQYATTAELLLVAYAVDNGPVKLWDVTQDKTLPQDLKAALEDERQTIKAHNAMFDRAILKHTLGYDLPFERWQCSLVQAYAHALPGSLDELGRVLNLPSEQQKLADGKKLIHRFCKPAPSNHKADRYDAATHPEEWQRFCDYAIQDVEALREIDKRLPFWNSNEKELALYQLDQCINARGFAVDTDFVQAAVDNEANDKAHMLEQFCALTGGQLYSPTQREKLKIFIYREYGIYLENTQKGTLEALIIDSETPDDCRKLCKLVLALTKSSVAKYRRLLPAISKDGRFRGGLQFNGASRTRRWSGRTFQPQNLPSRGIPSQETIEAYIAALKANTHHEQFDDLTGLSSAALRGVLVAPAGKKLLISDLASIESRVGCWLAGERWALKAYEDFDKGIGHDLYKLTAAQVFGKAPEAINKEERQLGKIACLAYGYQGAVGATQVFCQSFGFRMTDKWDMLQAGLSKSCFTKAELNYHAWGHQSTLPKDEWLACDAIKNAWRAKNKAICQLWYACQQAAMDAIKHPETTFHAGPHLAFRLVRHGGFSYLLCRLPSGNCLTYFEPRIEHQQITYFGVDSTAQRVGFKWQRQTTYGGKLVENACQSLARDILAHNMLAIEKRGFEIVLTVHDEVIAEVPDRHEFTDETLSQLLATNPPWAHGLPLAAEGATSYRYGKF